MAKQVKNERRTKDIFKYSCRLWIADLPECPQLADSFGRDADCWLSINPKKIIEPFFTHAKQNSYF